jgi:hypothetical protein
MPNHHEKDLTTVLVGQPTSLKAAPVGHSSRGVPGCQAEGLFAHSADRMPQTTVLTVPTMKQPSWMPARL